MILTTSLPVSYRTIFMAPNVALINIMACQTFRNVKFGVFQRQTFTTSNILSHSDNMKTHRAGTNTSAAILPVVFRHHAGTDGDCHTECTHGTSSPSHQGHSRTTVNIVVPPAKVAGESNFAVNGSAVAMVSGSAIELQKHPKDDDAASPLPDGATSLLPLTEEASFQALLQSFSMIIVSEIGDKTFLIAAILAMRHPRLLVFAGAFGSLVVMSILSAAMGHLLPTLIPRRWTQVAASILFLVFGTKMMIEARGMKSGNEKIQEEMKEAQEEIEDDEAEHEGRDGDDDVPLEALEAGKSPTHRRALSTSKSKSSKASLADGARNFCSLLLGPVFVQAFVLTFLGEWGDRSQIATIALGAAHNVYLVTLGTVVGHGCCTALAVIGGRYVSTKISVKHVTFGGAVLFLIFGFVYLYEAYTMGSDVDMSIPLTPSNEP
ncbi:hypothetical protein MD484_g8318, partial [Candolleomyces efflorescens]